MPRVFISYSHDLPEHCDAVLNLSDRLRDQGIDCIIDQYEFSPPEGWHRWTEKQIREADFVLMICSEGYYKKVMGMEQPGIGLGAIWEGNLIYQDLYDSGSQNTKFIPVLLKNGKTTYIPTPVKGATYYFCDTQEGYEKLYRHLTNQPAINMPELGKVQSLPPLQRQTDFFKPCNVPYPKNPFFTGREDVLKRLYQTLILTKATVISQTQAISGLGGIGKTQTAVEYTYRYRNFYKAILWVTAETLGTLISDFAKIAALLNLPEKDADQQELAVAAVKQWLQSNSDWLFIFDNADTPELIEDFMPIDFQGHILLTSRAQAFDNIGIINPIEMQKMSPNEAEKFLIKRTGRSKLPASERECLKKLAEELDYLPLALEQAGAYMYRKKCAFQDYLLSYRKMGITLLEKSKVIAAKYPKSVATTWLINFEQIEQTSQAAADILRVSAFLHPDKISLEIFVAGAKELGPEISESLKDVQSNPLMLDELLEPLSQYSLIKRDLASKTFNIHRLVQAAIKEVTDDELKKLWAERTVKALAESFPRPEFSTWVQCERLLPHAQLCETFINERNFEFGQASHLLNDLAMYLHDRGRYSETDSLYCSALRIAEKVDGIESKDVASICKNLADLYIMQGKYLEAEQLLKRALKIDEITSGKESYNLAGDYISLALIYSDQGKYLDAEPLYKRAIEISEKVLGPEHYEVATSLNNLAVLYRDQGNYAAAEPLLKRALEISEAALGPNHPSVATSLNNLALLYRDQGNYAAAEPLLKRALEISETALGPNHPDVAMGLNNLAELYRGQGNYAAAEPLFKRALEIYEAALGPNHPDVATSLNNLALLYYNQGNYCRGRAAIQAGAGNL